MDYGGFMLNGILFVFVGVMVVIFLFGGSEIVVVVVGELENLSRNVICVIKSVIVCVMVFYVGLVLILILCMLWIDKVNLKLLYVLLFGMVGFMEVVVVMKIVLFVLFMLVMNLFLFLNLCMLFLLS